VVEARFPIIGRIWITTAHDLAAQVLKDSATFSMRKEDGGLAGLRWWMPTSVRTLANSMLSMDEPAHTRLREIVDEAFRRRAILAMEPRIRGIADDLAASLFTEASEADLVERYARILPLSVICPLMATFSNRSAAMPTSKEYRHRAEECLRLANETKETFARMALLELAAEFCAKAQQLELRERRANTRQRFSSAIVRTRP